MTIERKAKNIARKTSGVFKINGTPGLWGLDGIIREFFFFTDEVHEIASLSVGEVFNNGIIITRVL